MQNSPNPNPIPKVFRERFKLPKVNQTTLSHTRITEEEDKEDEPP